MSIVIGITGGVATGKTTVMEMLRELGAKTLSADDIAREVLQPGTSESDEVVRRFGLAILDSKGRINRAALANIIFRDKKVREILNSITHPGIIAILEERIEKFRESAGEKDVLAVEIPLLVECNLSGLVDIILVVAAEQETQISRLKTRGLSDTQALERIAAQISLSEKTQAADWVIWTDVSLDDTGRQVRQVWDSVKSRNYRDKSPGKKV
jgi:dephospho-CoA kinase